MANGTLAASQIEMLSQSGTGIVTIVPPTTNTNRTLTLPDSTGTLLNTNGGTITGTLTVTGTLSASALVTASAGITISGGITTFGAEGKIAQNGSGLDLVPTTGRSFRVLNAAMSASQFSVAEATGNTSVSGTLSGGTSGTGYSFSGSAPATSLTLNSTGNLGVGTASPSYPLEIIKDASSVSAATIFINPTTGTNASVLGFNNSGSGGLNVGRSNSVGAGSGITLTAYDSFVATTGTTGIAFNTNNTTAMYISSGQNVGIGTSSPAAKLDVNGSAVFGAGAGNISINLNGANTGTGNGSYIGFKNAGLLVGGIGGYSALFGGAYSDNLGIYFQSGKALIISDAGSSSLTFQSGNLGLGVTPNITSLGGTYSLLAVGKASGSGIIMGQTDLTAADSTAAQFLGKTTGASGYQLLGGMLVQTDGSSTTNAVGRLTFYTATGGSLSERARIDSSGNLGLGVTPSAWTIGKVMQAGATSAFWDYSGTAYLSSNRYFGGGNKRIASGYATSYEQDSSTGNHVWAIAGTGAADSAISLTQAMTLDASGNLGVGTTTIRARLTVSDGDTNSAGEAVYQAYIVGTARTPSSDSTGMLTIQSTNAMAANVGGSIAFGGRALSANASGANWAFISGLKENATSGNYGGYLSFATRDTVGGGTTAERARIDSSGNLGLGVTPVSQNGKVFHIDGGAGAADIRLTNNATGSAINNGALFTLSGSDVYLWNLENNVLSFGTNNLERSRITSYGNLNVDYTSNIAANGTYTSSQVVVKNTIITGPQWSSDGLFGITTSTSGTVNTSGTLTLNLWYFNGSSNTGAVAGHLYVNTVNASSYSLGNCDVWKVTSYGGGTPNATFTLEQSTAGSVGGTSYTLTWNSSGQIIFTNTYTGFAYNFVAISFVGVTGILL